MVVQMDRLRRLLLMFGGLAALLVLPGVSRADYDINYGFDNSLSQQTINISPAQTGTTITGHTVPPPNYDVTITSDGRTLHGTGSTIDSPSAGNVDVITFTAASPYAWTYFDFQLDATNKNTPTGTTGLTITISGNGGTYSEILNFPWEGNSGENQHYMITAINGQWFDTVTINYTAPSGVTNHIQDIHTIDVASVQVIPAPPGVVLAGMGFLSLGLLRLRRVWAGRAAV